MMSGARGIRRITAVLAALVMAAACVPVEAKAATFESDWFTGKCVHGTDTCDICRGVDIDEVLYAFKDYEVESTQIKDPELVKLHVFDYWIKDQHEADNVTSELDKGINQKHLLKFVKDVSGQAEQNAYTKTEAPRTGVVQPMLDNGYPMAVIDNETERLDYLFNPAMQVEGRAAYKNATGLFQLDSKGYYYYNSMEQSTSESENDLYKDAYESANYAYLDQNNHFHLYNNWAVDHNRGASDGIIMHGQFMPFNPPNQVFQTIQNTATDKYVPAADNGKLIPPVFACSSPILNHFIGLSLEVPFVQAKDGKTQYIHSANGLTVEPTIFYFSGDDDMWLFIDDVLVGDIGGIHDASTLEINFATGDVLINKGAGYEGSVETSLREQFDKADMTNEQLGQIFREVKIDGETKYIFKDNSQHVIKMFYLERGHTASNLGIKFNLVTIPTSTLTKVDQDGNKLEGAEFAIYTAQKDGNTGSYAKASNNPILTFGPTDQNGVVNVLNKKGLPFSFGDLSGSHFIMEETQIPDGYRGVGEMHLIKHTLEDGSVVLVSDPDSPTGSKWSTGSYAAPMELTKATSDIYDRNNTQKIVSNNRFVPGMEGTLFAVVMKWVGGNEKTPATLNDPANWRPVVGNAHDGYRLIPVEGIDYDGAVKKALEQELHAFEIGSSGNYEVFLENMPGDILHYLHARAAGASTENVQYTVFYGWTSAVPGADKKFSADELDGKQFALLDSDNFTRSFSAAFLALNVKDQLHVRKTDAQGQPLEGVTFTLYKADGTTVHDFDVTGPDGTVTFPTPNGKPLAVGTYELAETAGPAGYVLKPDRVKVIVNENGIYADAGVAGDGITVERSVGHLVDSMHQFGMNNELDETLHSIRVTPQYAASEAFNSWQSLPVEYHLHHSDTEHAYVPTPGTNTNGTIYTSDVGWARLLIQQCYNHGTHTNHAAYREPLDDRDLSNLFTREVTIVFANDKYASAALIEGDKLLEGRDLQAGEFTFRLTPVTDGAPMPPVNDTVNEADGSFRFLPIVYEFDQAGVYQYRIDEVKDARGDIVYDESYWIVTVKADWDAQNQVMHTAVFYTHYDAKGAPVQGVGNPAQAVFINRWTPASLPQTGDDSALWLWALAMACSAAGAALVISRMRRSWR